jgi:hypothetical protein
MNMNRTILALAAAAVAGGISPAHAIEPLIAKLAEADDAVKDAAPQFGCYDQTDPKTCQQVRRAFTNGGEFATLDFANGEHVRCFSPGLSLSYRVCGGNERIWPEINNGTRWIPAPFSDPRCDHWGGPFTAEYLACEASLPPKPPSPMTEEPQTSPGAGKDCSGMPKENRTLDCATR